MVLRARVGAGATALTLVLLIVGFPLAAAGGPVAPNALAVSGGASPPNVVVITTDDETLAQLSVMPNVKSLLIDQGTTFANSYVSYSECCPSRSTFLTGQYAHNHGVLSGMLPTGGYTKLDHTNTLAVWLHNAGYFTSLTGKYLNGYGTDAPATVPPGWDDWWGLVDPSTYSYWGYTINQNGTPRTYGTTDADYSTTVLGNHVTDTIRSRAGNPQPFFLWYTPIAPHLGTRYPGDKYVMFPWPESKYIRTLESQTLPRDPSFNALDVSSKPSAISSLPLLTATQINGIDSWNHRARESLLSVDDQVANIVSALNDIGQLSNTLIVFTSDNGFFYGEYRIQTGKEYPYEVSSRVPLVIRGPSFPPGATRDQLVVNADLAPTIVAAGGATPGRVMDGIPLQPLAGDPTAGRTRSLLLENGPLFGRPTFSAVRTTRFVYIVWSTGFRELYDLQADPYELTNVVNVPSYGLALWATAVKLGKLKNCAGTVCQTA